MPKMSSCHHFFFQDSCGKYVHESLWGSKKDNDVSGGSDRPMTKKILLEFKQLVRVNFEKHPLRWSWDTLFNKLGDDLCICVYIGRWTRSLTCRCIMSSLVHPWLFGTLSTLFQAQLLHCVADGVSVLVRIPLFFCTESVSCLTCAPSSKENTREKQRLIFGFNLNKSIMKLNNAERRGAHQSEVQGCHLPQAAKYVLDSVSINRSSFDQTEWKDNPSF